MSSLGAARFGAALACAIVCGSLIAEVRAEDAAGGASGGFPSPTATPIERTLDVIEALASGSLAAISNSDRTITFFDVDPETGSLTQTSTIPVEQAREVRVTDIRRLDREGRHVLLLGNSEQGTVMLGEAGPDRAEILVDLKDRAAEDARIILADATEPARLAIPLEGNSSLRLLASQTGAAEPHISSLGSIRLADKPVAALDLTGDGRFAVFLAEGSTELLVFDVHGGRSVGMTPLFLGDPQGRASIVAATPPAASGDGKTDGIPQDVGPRSSSVAVLDHANDIMYAYRLRAPSAEMELTAAVNLPLPYDKPEEELGRTLIAATDDFSVILVSREGAHRAFAIHNPELWIPHGPFQIDVAAPIADLTLAPDGGFAAFLSGDGDTIFTKVLEDDWVEAAVGEGSGALVADLQRRLIDFGYSIGWISGRDDMRTKAAVAALGRDVGLPGIGVHDVPEVNRLIDSIEAEGGSPGADGSGDCRTLPEDLRCPATPSRSDLLFLDEPPQNVVTDPDGRVACDIVDYAAFETGTMPPEGTSATGDPVYARPIQVDSYEPSAFPGDRGAYDRSCRHSCAYVFSRFPDAYREFCQGRSPEVARQTPPEAEDQGEE